MKNKNQKTIMPVKIKSYCFYLYRRFYFPEIADYREGNPTGGMKAPPTASADLHTRNIAEDRHPPYRRKRYKAARTGAGLRKNRTEDFIEGAHPALSAPLKRTPIE